MNHYLIKIGQTTKKGNFQELYQFAIMSEADKNAIQDAYMKKYDGFSISVSVFDKVDIVNTGDVEVQKDIAKKPEPNIRTNDYDSKLYADVSKEEIPGFDEIMQEIWYARKNLSQKEEEAKKKITSILGLKRVDYLNFIDGGVRFAYYPSWYIFAKKEPEEKREIPKEENPFDDVPF